MSINFRKKTPNALVTILIGFIVVSFMFTGYESMKGTPDTVALVGKQSVKIREYQLEYDRQINFYRQITGGKNLTTQQIEQFRVKDNVINNLVTRKLMLELGNKMGVVPAPQEISQKIKDLPYFKTNDQFDITRYKALLKANQLTPRNFEQDISNEVLASNAQKYFNHFPFSDGYIKDIIRYKNTIKTANLVQITRESLRPQIKVSKKEIAEYLKVPVNVARLENTFKERKPTFDKPEMVKASHILISSNKPDAQKRANEIAAKVNRKNFAKLANQYTEDPAGKGKGGSLGEFARGKMVPEFEKVAFGQKVGTISKPVKSTFGYHIIYTTGKKPGTIAKLKDHQNDIATELIRKTKNKELDLIYANVKKEIEQNLIQSKISSLKKMQKKYGFKFEQNASINRYDGLASKINLDKGSLDKIFSNTKDPLLKFNQATRDTFVKILDNNAKPQDLKVKTERDGLKTAFSRKAKDQAIKQLREEVKVKVFANILR